MHVQRRLPTRPTPRSAASSATHARTSAACWAATRPNARTSRARSRAVRAALGGNSCVTYAPVAPACTGSPAGVMWNPVANAPSATTLLQDSNGSGVVCRHNNQVYAVSGVPLAGGAFTYPRTLSATSNPQTSRDGPHRIPTRPARSPRQRPAAARRSARRSPFRATITRSTRSSSATASTRTVNGQWKGFGTGVCQVGERPHDVQERQVWPVPSLRPRERRPHSIRTSTRRHRSR